MIKKIRIMLEYDTYCLWLHNEENEIVDNDNPPEWKEDAELTEAFMKVSDLYDTFFIDNENEFTYVGCPDKATGEKLKNLFSKAMGILEMRNKGKYVIQNDVDLDHMLQDVK